MLKPSSVILLCSDQTWDHDPKVTFHPLEGGFQGSRSKVGVAQCMEVGGSPQIARGQAPARILDLFVDLAPKLPAAVQRVSSLGFVEFLRIKASREEHRVGFETVALNESVDDPFCRGQYGR